MPKVMSAEDKKWQTESDVRTLREAIEVINDAKRLAAAKKMAAEQKTALDAVAEIDQSFLAKIGMSK